MLHVVMGPPCSGKSTYVREHAQEGDVRVDYDAIAMALGEVRAHGATGAIKEAAYKARTAVVNYLTENADDVEGWIIHSEPADWQMEAYEKAGAEMIPLTADEETCLERAEQDERPPEEVEEIHKWFERHRKGAFLMEDGMKITKKTVEAKADNGSIVGYASTWTREPDSYGDVVAKGAFAESIARIKEEGRVLPLLYNHNESDLKNYIGTVINLEEDDHGLKFKATFDDTEEGQRARQLATDGRLCKFSFSYDVLDQGNVTLEDGTEANELRKLDIHEVSLVLYPANPDTSVVEVKSAAPEEKSGRRNSAKDEEKLRQIIQLAQDCLGELDDTEDEPDDKPEEPGAVNGKDREEVLLKEAEELLRKE